MSNHQFIPVFWEKYYKVTLKRKIIKK